VTVQQDDLLEAVVSERCRDVENLFDERVVVRVNRAGKVHHVSGVAVRDSWQHEHLVGVGCSDSVGNRSGTHQVNVQRQVVTVLLDRPARNDANLILLNGIVNFRPREFLVAVFGAGFAGHRVVLS
jgi:hypothetical protein